MWKAILGAVRTSEFWVLLFQAYVEATTAPVPEEFQMAAWVYIAARVVKKVVVYVFPNPAKADGAWLKKD